MAQSLTHDVLILGAGLAGLRAAVPAAERAILSLRLRRLQAAGLREDPEPRVATV